MLSTSSPYHSAYRDSRRSSIGTPHISYVLSIAEAPPPRACMIAYLGIISVYADDGHNSHSSLPFCWCGELLSICLWFVPYFCSAETSKNKQWEASARSFVLCRARGIWRNTLSRFAFPVAICGDPQYTDGALLRVMVQNLEEIVYASIHGSTDLYTQRCSCPSCGTVLSEPTFFRTDRRFSVCM